ncbi:hypothetical protein LOK49_LG02G01124 [Camellia lanceoleosa]|uniref:Uncharacterized protein n=1 Tax=Camellia lanceoleosa TaxID=1840588 RepID=A0ACC0IS48_9ERIC|nr:hypothetical protein LOK49_LG02G01124 [Camellia lanceoleosa]
MRVVTSDMLKFVQELRKVVTVGVVGGSDLVKISSSLGTQYKLYCSIFFKLSVLVFFVFLHSIFQKFFRSNIMADCLTFYSMFAICAVINDYDDAFAENGHVAYKDGKLIGTQSLRSYLGEEKLKGFINFMLDYIADLDIPIKRGTFIEFQSGMLNVLPIGRNCSLEERDTFE